MEVQCEIVSCGSISSVTCKNIPCAYRRELYTSKAHQESNQTQTSQEVSRLSHNTQESSEISTKTQTLSRHCEEHPAEPIKSLKQRNKHRSLSWTQEKRKDSRGDHGPDGENPRTRQTSLYAQKMICSTFLMRYLCMIESLQRRKEFEDSINT